MEAGLLRPSPLAEAVFENFGVQSPSDRILSHLAATANSWQAAEDYLYDEETNFTCAALERLANDIIGYDSELFDECMRYLQVHEAASKLRTKSAATTTSERSWYRNLLIFLEVPQSSFAARFFFGLMTTLVVVSCVCLVIETLPQYNPKLNVAFAPVWTGIDWGATVIFTGETVARFVANVLDDRVLSSKLQNALSFFKRPANLVDIAALLPTYFEWAFEQYGRVVTGALRTLRLLRLLKFLRRFTPIRRLVQALQRSVAGLVAPFLFLGLAMILLASTVFFMEAGKFSPSIGAFWIEDQDCLSEPYSFLPQFSNFSVNSSIAAAWMVDRCPITQPHFESVGQTLWFAIVTFATVGFGDFVPITPAGKFVAGLGMIAGLLFVAMPIAVIGTNYTMLMGQRQAEKERERETRSKMVDESAASVGPNQIFAMPSETFLEHLQQLTQCENIDLANPGDDVLFLTDLLLEASIKQLVNARCGHEGRGNLFGDDESAGLSPSTTAASQAPERRRNGQSKLPVATLPLWLAAVHCSTPSKLFHTNVVDAVTLSRPQSLILGASDPQEEWHSVNLSRGAADVALYTPALQEVMQRESGLAVHRPGDALRLSGEPDSLCFAALPSNLFLRPPVSQRHGTLVITRMWNETRVMVRNFDGCTFAILRKYRPSVGETLAEYQCVSPSHELFGVLFAVAESRSVGLCGTAGWKKNCQEIRSTTSLGTAGLAAVALASHDRPSQTKREGLERVRGASTAPLSERAGHGSAKSNGGAGVESFDAELDDIEDEVLDAAAEEDEATGEVSLIETAVANEDQAMRESVANAQAQWYEHVGAIIEKEVTNVALLDGDVLAICPPSVAVATAGGQNATLSELLEVARLNPVASLPEAALLSAAVQQCLFYVFSDNSSDSQV